MKRFSLIIMSLLLMIFFTSLNFGAGHVDPDMPVPYNVTLSSDGEVNWSIEDTVDVPDPENPSETITRHYIYKKFYLKLQKRYAEYISGTSTYEYQWRDFGSEKVINVSGNDSTEYYGSVEVSSPGLYAVKVRAYSAENAYSDWSDVSPEAAFDSSTTNINITQGSSVSSNYGPGTVYGGSSGMFTTNPYQNNNNLNYGNATNIIGTNGQYITSNGMGSAYIYDNKYQNNINYQGTSTANIGVGPGFNSGVTNDQTMPGPGNNSQVITYNNNAIQSPNFNLYTTNTNQIIPSGPSQSGNGTGMGSNQQYWSKEIGWHHDNIGFYYYNGNGEYLRDKWYFIDNYYYRFDSSSYAMISKWFKDPTNSCWYYLGAEGKMLTGWQNIEGVWYYLNPDRGTNFGVMYSNCSMNIGGKYYAFNSEGGLIMNGYYNGSYYGNDGTRQ